MIIDMLQGIVIVICVYAALTWRREWKAAEREFDLLVDETIKFVEKTARQMMEMQAHLDDQACNDDFFDHVVEQYRIWHGELQGKKE